MNFLGGLYQGENTNWDRVRSYINEAAACAKSLEEVCGSDSIRKDYGGVMSLDPIVSGFIKSAERMLDAKKVFEDVLTKGALNYDIAYLPLTPTTEKDFFKAKNKSEIINRIKEVVEEEAPICESLLISRVASSFEIENPSEKLKGYMRRLFLSCSLKCTMQNRELIIWKEDQNPSRYRHFRKCGSGVRRRAPAEVPVQEASNTFCHILSLAVMDDDELKRQSARIMGYDILEDGVDKLLDAGLELAEKYGRIFRDDVGKWELSDAEWEAEI